MRNSFTGEARLTVHMGQGLWSSKVQSADAARWSVELETVQAASTVKAAATATTTAKDCATKTRSSLAACFGSKFQIFESPRAARNRRRRGGPTKGAGRRQV